MKRIKSMFLLVAVLLFGVFGVFTACNGGKVTISFETNGGGQIASVSVEKGSEYTLPDPEQRTGYSFEGWYLDSECNGEAVKTVKPESDVTVYAKWTQLYKLTLDAGDGKSNIESLYLKAGDSLTEKLAGIVPEIDADHQFGGWFRGNSALTANDKMPAEDLTVSARYKIKYTIHLFKQNLENDDYTAAEDFVGYEFAGRTPTYTEAGFKSDTSHEGYVGLKELTETVSENVFTLYLQRLTATLNLYSNNPDGGITESLTVEEKFGASIKLPTDSFGFTGYALIGWNKDGSSNVEYESSYIYDNLYNRDGETEPELYTVNEENVSLYAVWGKGYPDAFGSADVVYHFSEDDEAVYLYRDGVFFKGDYEGNNEFTLHPEGRTVEGRLESNGTFMFFNEARQNSVYNFYSIVIDEETNRIQSVIDPNITITLDEYNGITYVKRNTETQRDETSHGTYYLDENDYMVATFEDGGPMAGKTVTIYAHSISNRAIFEIRNDEDYELGILQRFVDETRYYSNNMYAVMFTGFGTAVMNTGSMPSIFYYQREGDEIKLLNSNGSVAMILRLMPDQTIMKGYYLYSEQFDHTYEGENGATLTLDGGYKAIYKNSNNETVEGNYMAYSVELGGYMIKLTIPDPQDPNKAPDYSFLIYAKEKPAAEEGADPEYEYTFETVLNSYSQYYYSLNGSEFYVPLLVMDDNGVNSMSLYGWDDDGNYKLFATGTYEQNKQEGYENTFLFTLKEFHPITGAQNPNYKFDFNVEQLESFVFGLFSRSQYNAYFLYSYTLKESEPSAYDKQYTNGAGDEKETLTLVSGFAFYKFPYVDDEGNTVKASIFGQYSLSDTIVTLASSSGTYYFEINEEDSTFINLRGLYGTIYSVDSNGNRDSGRALTFDGKGGVVYREGTTSYQGTYEQGPESDLTYFGDRYYIFRANEEDKEFKFMFYSSSSSAFFVIFDETLEGVYNAKANNGATLRLDGYAWCEYTDENGQTTDSICFYNDEMKMLIMIIDGAYRYIELDKEENTFELLGIEYSDFVLWFDNWTVRINVYFALDGKNHLTAYEWDGRLPLREQKVLDAQGTYEIDDNGTDEPDDDVYTFRFKDESRKLTGEEDVVIRGMLGVISLSSRNFRAILVEHIDREGTYVNPEDWSVIKLDSLGNATKTDKIGNSQTGTYTLIDDDMLFYSSNTESAIFILDAVKKTAVQKTYNTVSYYTEDFEALNFSSSGFAYILGEYCYYRIDGNKNVILYRRAQEGQTEGLTQYGFIKDNTIGTLTEETKKYTVNGQEKTFYKDDGFSVDFTRTKANDQDDTKNYPLNLLIEDEENDIPGIVGYLRNLNFGLPIGDGNFAVNGTITLEIDVKNESGEFTTGGTTYKSGEERDFPCTLVREVISEGDDSHVEFYLLFQSSGIATLRYDISAKYHGPEEIKDPENPKNTYTVDRARALTTLSSYNYLELYMMIYMYLGQSLPDTFGTITLGIEIDKDGTEKDKYISSAFDVDAGLTDYNGNLVQFTENAYTYTSESQMYTVDVKANDGFNYRLRFIVDAVQGMGTFGYRIYSFTRIQTFYADKDGKCYIGEEGKDLDEEPANAAYKIEIERLIATDTTSAPGSLMYVNLYEKKDDGYVRLDLNYGYYLDGNIYNIVREFEPDSDTDGIPDMTKITKTTLYKVELKEHNKDIVGGEDNRSVIEYYEGATLSVKELKTYYNEDKTEFVDIDEEAHEVVIFFRELLGSYYVFYVDGCTYDEGTDTYTVDTTYGERYTIKVNENDTVTITEIEDEEEEL